MTPMDPIHCPNCNYNNAQATGTDYVAQDSKGSPLKNADGSDRVKQVICARCGYGKTAEHHAEEKKEALKLRGVEASQEAPVLETPQETNTVANLPKEEVAAKEVAAEEVAAKDPAEAEAERHIAS